MNIPTRPGWWWRQGNHGPYIEEVEGDQNHALFVSLSGTTVEDDGSWLAEVPTPDVCAAVVEFYEGSPWNDDALLYLGDALRAARKGQEVSDG